MSYSNIVHKYIAVAILLLLIFIFSSCNQNTEGIPQYLIPYNSLDNNTISDSIVLKRELVPDQSIKSSILLENVFGSSFPPQPIDFINLETAGSLIYLHDVQSLYQLRNDYSAELVAEPGEGPHSIQSGIKLINSSKKPILLQRNRISEVDCNKDCRLSVIKTTEDFYNYINHFSDSTYIVNGYNPDGEPSIYLKDHRLQTVTTLGEGFKHENPELTRNFNFSGVELGLQGQNILHAFSDFPTLAMIDVESDAIKAFTISDFYSHKLSDNNRKGELVDYDVPHSRIYSIKSLPGKSFWVSVIHAKESSEKREGYLDSQSYFDYYFLNKESGLEYAGSSYSMVVPDKDQVLFMHDFSIYLLEKDIYSYMDLLSDQLFKQPF
ncbi:hypothetical protein [Rhodohalobacter halophilus]|uniref:hypothetical protein n=1 Tax=Rhodohalobacter halophilus TaxID=1812810 RepID=UPI00114CE1E9|nr:hypothetical protein [Rhodohalobacter halophilus]